MKNNLLNCQVIILPTNIKAKDFSNTLVYCESDDTLTTTTKPKSGPIDAWCRLMNQGYKAQHLYLISDRKIKEGDYVISTFDKWTNTSSLKPQLGKILKISKRGCLIDSFNGDDDNWWNIGHSKKIEATTDPNVISTANSLSSVKYHSSLLIPGIPESFIKAFVKSQGSIKEVQIELKDLLANTDISTNNRHCTHIPMLVVNTRSDNTVIIHQSKTYSREEVIRIAWNAQCIFISKELQPLRRKEFDEWIEENL